MGGLMMLLGMSAATATSAPDLVSDPLSQIFISACLDGEARLGRDEARPISFNDLPNKLQQRLDRPSSSQIWRLNADGRTFLYILDYPAEMTNPRICGLASDQMNSATAASAVEKRVMGDVYPETGPSMQWTDPKGGYVVTATKVGEFKVLQTNLLSDAERAALAEKYHRVLP